MLDFKVLSGAVPFAGSNSLAHSYGTMADINRELNRSEKGVAACGNGGQEPDL